ncbi:hypothetical protein HGRIS_011350 [Hohenbuehelia grisea]|uniref:Hydrophobin n=1 Tax=Hohenbuehelia grisea TaxID=104357 RepID=A0ABR3JWJ6_9AGAR
MFFSKTTIFASVVGLLATVAGAVPNPNPYYPGPHSSSDVVSSTSSSIIPEPTPPVTGNCNVGPVQCCNSLQESDSSSVSDIFNLLGSGLNLAGSTGQVGFACSPTVADTGLGGNTGCSQQAACCENTDFNGLIAIGCMPISL